MRAIKWYHIFDDDIDDKGNINPDARLLPYFFKQYQWDADKNPVETVSSVDHYDNNTNVHKGRVFDVFEDGIDDLNREPVFVKNRGYSALGYVRGREKYDNVFDDWHSDHIEKLAPKYIEETADRFGIAPENFEYHSVNHLPFNSKDDRITIGAIPENDKIILADTLSNMNAVNGYNPSSYRGRPVTAVPFIIEGDDDDIVSLADVLERGYDPGRDFTQEVQLKNIKTKRLPSGILVPHTGMTNTISDDTRKDRRFDVLPNNGTFWWENVLDKNFNINDAQNVSDVHCKHIIKDAGNYIKKYGKKNVSGIANSIFDWRF